MTVHCYILFFIHLFINLDWAPTVCLALSLPMRAGARSDYILINPQRRSKHCLFPEFFLHFQGATESIKCPALSEVCGLHCTSLNQVSTRALSDQVCSGSWHVFSQAHKQKYRRTTFSNGSKDLWDKQMEKFCWYLGSLLQGITKITWATLFTTCLQPLCRALHTRSHLLLHQWEKGTKSSCLHIRRMRLGHRADSWQRKD